MMTSRRIIGLSICAMLCFVFPAATTIPPNSTITDLITSDKELPIIGIIAAHPERVERIAKEFLKDVDLHSNIRGYTIYTGTYQGKRVFVAYTAMGGPTVSMIVENLIMAGAKRIVRIGTSDNDNAEQELTSLLVISETMGLTGMMLEYGFAPEEAGTLLPASPSLNSAILSSAKRNQIEQVKLAKAYNIDAYHVYSDPARFAKNEKSILDKIAYYKNEGATVRDMESGTLFMLGQLRSIETATVLISVIKHKKETAEQREFMLKREGDAIYMVLEALTQDSQCDGELICPL